jgi:AraC-like DNA-binding protein
VDVLNDLLHRARVRNAIVRQSILRPPWSIHLADPEPLTAVATLGGRATVALHKADGRDAAGAPALDAGDFALIKGGDYTIADNAATPCQVIIRAGHKQVVGTGGAATVEQMSAPRTYGDQQSGATTILHAIYELHGSAGDRLLGLLPALTVLSASPRTRSSLELLSAEAARDEPGQDAVLKTLLELLLVIALRHWGASTGAERPTWLGAIADPAIGEALAMLHADPRRRWTTAELAHVVGMSRAALSARFTRLVGEPPMAYLTGWRMTLAADALRDTDAPVAAVAHDVGYENAFAFSVAFKRALGHSPKSWRRNPEPPRRSSPQQLAPVV